MTRHRNERWLQMLVPALPQSRQRAFGRDSWIDFGRCHGAILE